MMRHADIATTMRYYVQIGADDVAAGLWAKHRRSDSVAQAPNEGDARPEAEATSASGERV